MSWPWWARLPGAAAGVAPGWHAYVPPVATPQGSDRPAAGADWREDGLGERLLSDGLPGGPVVELPGWPVEVALSVEMPGPQSPARTGWLSWQVGDRLGLALGGPSALLALRGAGLAWPLVDRLRGTAVLGRVSDGRAVTLPRPVELPGLAPAGAAAVRRHLALAGTRGVADRDPGDSEVAGARLGSRGAWQGRAYGLHPGGRAARHSRTNGAEVRWAVGAGADVRASGPFGRSVQAIVTLHGNGEPELLVPPPGGALVLRAWRDRTDWQVLCAVVVAAGVGISAGRIAGRLARLAITRSWDAAALTGRAAMTAARAGDPRHRPPARVARPLPPAAFHTLLAGCLHVAATATAATPSTSTSTPFSPPGPSSGSPSGSPSGAEPGSEPEPSASDNASAGGGLHRLLADLAARPLPAPAAEEPPEDPFGDQPS